MKSPRRSLGGSSEQPVAVCRPRGRPWEEAAPPAWGLGFQLAGCAAVAEAAGRGGPLRDPGRLPPRVRPAQSWRCVCEGGRCGSRSQCRRRPRGLLVCGALPASGAHAGEGPPSLLLPPAGPLWRLHGRGDLRRAGCVGQILITGERRFRETQLLRRGRVLRLNRRCRMDR